MKKLSLAILTAATMLSGAALADNHTVSLGYAQSDFENLGDIRGVNVQYRYEWNSPLSIVGSFTYMTKDGNNTGKEEGDSWKLKYDMKYYSLLAGPAYRINDYVSVYALGGVAHVTLDEDSEWNYNWGFSDYEKTSSNSTSFAWGAGVQFNPTDNLAFGLGYEGTTADFDGKYGINGFNLTVGYRF